MLLCKGADSIIKERLDLKNDAENAAYMELTQRYVDLYAVEGLRTLLLAKKTLNGGEYEAWNNRF